MEQISCFDSLARHSWQRCWPYYRPIQRLRPSPACNRVASGLTSPIFVTHAPGDPSRVFIVERGGAIHVLNLRPVYGKRRRFLSIPSVDEAGEGGLLGTGVPPRLCRYQRQVLRQRDDRQRRRYVLGVTSPFSTHIREYTVTRQSERRQRRLAARDSAIRSAANQSQRRLDRLQPASIGHTLYIATGDGGGGNDTATGHTAGTGNAQDITNNLLGKMLRIDPTGDDFPADATAQLRHPAHQSDAKPASAARPTTSATMRSGPIGLRNPFRDSFDRLTGDLWIGDVGQGAARGGRFSTGQQHGRRELRLAAARGTASPTPTGRVGGTCRRLRQSGLRLRSRRRPIRRHVITGGYVYRGPDPTLRGKYFFLDSRTRTATQPTTITGCSIPTNPFGTVTNIDALLSPRRRQPAVPRLVRRRRGRQPVHRLHRLGRSLSDRHESVRSRAGRRPAPRPIGMFLAD